MAATSEDEDKTQVSASSSGMQSATDDYEGDDGESYPDDDAVFDDFEGEFDDSDELDDYEDDEDEDDELDELDETLEDGLALAHGDTTGSSTGAPGPSSSQGHGHGPHGPRQPLNGFEDNDSDRLSRARSGLRARRSQSRETDSAPPPFPQHNFAPPFYGRPPTPLPPSPSLTSLLRPSRPTTPDASDDDLEPVPRAAPQVPTYEYYGFVLYLFSSLAFLIYLLWSYLPSPFLHALGIYYYPNRWWSLAIPSFLVMALVYIYVALAAYNTEILTLPLDSIETIVDGAAKLAAVDEDGGVVIIGGADGTQVQGRGATAGDIQHQKNTGQARSQARSQSQPKHHARQPSAGHPSSPSPPSPPLLGKSAWRDWNARSGGRTDDEGLTMGRGRDWSGRTSRTTDASSHEADGRSSFESQKSQKSSRSDGRSGRSHTGTSHTSHRSPREWNRLWNVGTDAVMDIPLAGVCEVLYA